MNRSVIRCLAVTALCLMGMGLVGAEAPTCIPIEPTDTLCTADEECTWCAYGSAPSSTSDCCCRDCPHGPMTVAECDRNAEAYERFCNPDVWPSADLCDGDYVCDDPLPPRCGEDGLCVEGRAGCGDATIGARYDECRSAGDQASCEAAGGWWDIIGLSLEPVCQCPTGQGDCPCESSLDCLSSCIAEFPTGLFDCEGARGHCSPVSLTVGCFCWFGEDGEAMAICAD